MKPISIAMISFYYLPEYSGSAKQANRLINQLKKFNVNSCVISAQLNAEWPLRENIDGVEIIRVPVYDGRPLLRFWIGVARQLWKMRSEIDLVHSHGMNPLHGFPLFFGNLLGKVTIGKLTIACSDIYFKGQGRIIGRLHKWFLRHSDGYIATSSALQDELSQSGLASQKCYLIPNGVDTDIFYPLAPEGKKALRSSLGIKDEVVFLFVGVIDKRKGVDVLIPAFNRVLKANVNAKLYLVGPQNREDKESSFINLMKKLVSDLGIKDKIIFCNYSNNVVPYFQAADLFVLPSRNEGLANVILEAMSCGLPVIGTKISGTEDLINPNVEGLLVPPGDEASLGEAMASISRAPQTMGQMAAMAYKKAVERYSIKHISKAYFNIYKKLLKIN